MSGSVRGMHDVLNPRRLRKESRISGPFRIVYLTAIALIVASFVLQMLMGICPVP